jgi:MoaA/NifB/PqqE/SkfB family radical SAM enzyme
MGEPLMHPLGLLAEVTHRCPLGCPYCSNPIALESRADEIDAVTWARVFAEAADLGVLQVHLSGGEPTARRDIVEITAAAHSARLYTNLITSAVGVTEKMLAALAEAGLDHVQISSRMPTLPRRIESLATTAPTFANALSPPQWCALAFLSPSMLSFIMPISTASPT